jgi:hypothetical protein
MRIDLLSPRRASLSRLTCACAKKNRPGASPYPKGARTQRRGKVPLRQKSGGDSGRAVAPARELSPLARLIYALQQAKIRFQIAGMSGAILQGAPATTLDTDIWVDLPPRQYMTVLNLCRALGGEVRANTLVDLSDGSVVNFLYEVHGLGSFRAEYRKAKKIKWLGTRVSVLPLERIYASKKFVGRPKDIAHLPLLEQTMRLRRKIKGP